MSVHSKTPTLSVSDPRGLSIRTVGYWRSQPNGPARTCVSRTNHDVAGRAVAQWDPRLWALQVNDPQAPANLISVYLLNGQVLRLDSVDAGMQITLPGVGAQALFEWDSRGTRREVHYDPLLRPVAVFEEGASQPPRCIERLAYGQPGAGDPTRNQLGQLIRHDDPAGSVLFDAFAISGQCTENSRHFTQDLAIPDWPEEIDQRTRLLEPGEGATTRWRFGPLHQIIEQIDARGNRHGSEWTVDGRLRASYLQLKHQSEARMPVTDVHYNADGLVTQEVAGNGVRTTLTYRPTDGVLQERQAKKNDGEVLQHLIYDYDPMGNVSSIEDKAMPVRYFANQRIEPVSRFTYDSFYQLIEATGWEAGVASQGPASVGRFDPAAFSNYRQTYRYDAGGNLLELTHVGAQTHGRQFKTALYSNRGLGWRNGTPPTEEQIAGAFDSRGNLLELGQGQFVRWNLRNQAQLVCPVERLDERDDEEVYRYDAGGQRVRKIRSLQTNARSVFNEVRYLPGLEMRTDSSSGEVLQVITVQGELNSLNALHWETSPPSGGNDRYRYIFTDHLGSASLELAENARAISQATYYPSGETAWSRESEVSYRTVRYSGKEQDATGLYYYGYRYYIPWQLRWLNPDPAGMIDGLNLYRAVRNNPLTFFDEQGTEPGSRSAVGSAIEIFESYKKDFDEKDRELPYQMMDKITKGALKFKTAKTSAAILEKTKAQRFTLRHYTVYGSSGAMPPFMEIASNFSLVNKNLKILGGKGGNTNEKDWTKAGNMGFTFFLLAVNGEVNERKFLSSMTHFAEYDLDDDNALQTALGNDFDQVEFFASPDVLDPKHSSNMSAVPMIKGRIKDLKALLLGNSGISPVQVGRMDSRTLLNSLDNAFHGTLEVKIPGSVKVSQWHRKVTTQRKAA
jgi:insecticidal toxin complex protein TccC